MIPQELQDLNQWTHSYDVRDLKRPKHSHYSPNASLSYQAAVAIAKRDRLSFGMYTTLKDNYVIGDIDHVDDPMDALTMPTPEITEFLLQEGIYSEVSPSGEGIRFVFRLPKSEGKSDLRGKVFYTRYPKKDKRECQVNIGPPWLRFTGNETPYSSSELGEISITEVDKLFAVKYKSDDPLAELIGKDDGVTHDTPTDDRLPTLQEMMLAMDNIPLDQSPRIVRAYEKVFKQTYSHYDFWLRVIMAMHDFATKTGTAMDCLVKVCQWSATDPDSYTGEEDVLVKWKSLADDEDHVSFHTVMALAYANSLIWPVKKPLTKAEISQGKVARQPINSEYANFEAMTEFYGLKLHQDVNSPAKMYLTGDEDIIKRFFKSMSTTLYYEKYRGIFDFASLVPAFHIMCQEMGFIGLSHVHVQQHIKNWIYQMNSKLDLVKLYFDTPFEDLPESYKDNREFLELSTVEYMFSCLEVDHLTANIVKENKLYFKYYKAWLMGLVRNLYWPNDPHMNNGVLLLSGPEQIRKTSHFRYMLPKFMREERIAFTTHGFANEGSIRDLVKLASGNNLVVWDEIEQYLTSETESNFKKLVDSTPTKLIDKYATIESVFKPIAMYGATSNQREFRLSDTGSRRLFHIPVKWVKTDQLDKICWWRIVNDLKAEIENHKGDDPPWLLTRDELEFQASLHSKVTAQSGLEITIREIFNFNQQCFVPQRGDVIPDCNPLNSPNFLTTKKVIDQIDMHTGGRTKINRAQLTRILHNLCGRWTKTTNSTRLIMKPKMKINRGVATYGGSHRLWVLPLPLNPYDK